MNQDHCVEDDDDFMMGVETRSRCYTWPVQQFSSPNGGSGQYSLSQQAPLELLYQPQYLMMPKFSSTSDSSTFQRFVDPNNVTSQQHQFTYQLPSNSTSIINGISGNCLSLYRQQKPTAPPLLPSIAMSNGQQLHQHQLKFSPPAKFGDGQNLTSSTDQFMFKQELLDEIREYDMTATGGYPPDLHPDSQYSTPQEKPKLLRRKNNMAEQKMSHKKPNSWGKETYSDLIARALRTAIDGRLKLNEIYQWFSVNIPYFAERSSQEEAQGWKNAIRHNLSLHSRFMRIQNEGAYKSSWWVINPDAKPGSRNPRRRANTMESTKATTMKKRPSGSSFSRKTDIRGNGASAMHSINTSIVGLQFSSVVSLQDSHNGIDRNNVPINGTVNANFDTFRPRTLSTLSIPGYLSHFSPTHEPPGFEDFEFPSWMDSRTQQQQNANGENNQQQVKKIVDRTDRIQILKTEFNSSVIPYRAWQI